MRFEIIQQLQILTINFEQIQLCIWPLTIRMEAKVILGAIIQANDMLNFERQNIASVAQLVRAYGC